MSTIQELRSYLFSLTRTQVVDDVVKLETLMAECWDEFEGGYETGMTGNKLLGRMEEIEWNPPILSFNIDRHGATIMGSSRAYIQKWYANVEEVSARFEEVSYRQILPKQHRVDVNPLAEEIARKITEFQENDSLKRYDNGSVQVLMGKVIPEAGSPKQTINGRRKRFRKALDKMLSDAGWIVVRANVYKPPKERASLL
jgi:hypothetical protein